MKQFIFSFFLILGSYTLYAQNNLPYKPDADAATELQQAIQQAGNENKHVLVVVGGNWCPWCRMLSAYYHDNDTIAQYLSKEYVVVKVNYSKENKNPEVMKQLEYPQRFGFPVLVVLDDKGKRIHTQNSAYLEQGKGYSTKEMLNFLKAWSKPALDPEQYNK